MRVMSNLAGLKEQIETINGRAYTVEEIARGSDLSRHTITKLLDNDATAVYFETIEGLLTYLRGQGLSNAQISDILTLDETGTPGKQKPVRVVIDEVAHA